VIARFLILLPFDLLITEAAEGPAVEVDSSDYHARVYVPFLYAARPKPTDSVVALSLWPQKLTEPFFTENLLVDGHKVAQVNVLVIDFIKSEFNRSRVRQQKALDPPAELAFEIANFFLARIRVYSRAFQIKPLIMGRDPWELRYLTDDLEGLEHEEDKIRGHISCMIVVGSASITPDTIQMVGTEGQTTEPYAWDQLLLDAHALLPDVGSAIVIAAAALETFSAWALQLLHEQRPLPPGLWDWINNRDHWSKEPSVSEEFDVLLRAFTGHSLKDDEPQLWQQFTELRKARNSLVHDGVAKIGEEPVHSTKAKELIDAADKIVAWTELLIPESHRRARTVAAGQFFRRLATPDESKTLGPAHIETGQLGGLPPGSGITFSFGRKQDDGTWGEPHKKSSRLA